MKKTISNKPFEKINFADKEEQYRKINNDLENRKITILKESERSISSNEFLEKKTSFIKDKWDAEEDLEEFEENYSIRPVSSSSVTKSRSSVVQRNRPQNLKSIKKSNSSIVFNEDLNYDLENYDDIIPAVANEMSDEAQIRFLKASLKVMKQDKDILIRDNKAKDESLRELQNKYKEAEEVRQKLQKSGIIQNSQVEKLRKQVEEYKQQNTNLEVQLQGIRKESDLLQKSEKFNLTSKGNIDVKLNKALEECEKYKSQVEKLNNNKKEIELLNKQQMDELIQENKRLEKQKNELLNAYKKQMKLIDVYKRLQMHMEASRLLSFTEDEFIRALEINTADIDEQ